MGSQARRMRTAAAARAETLRYPGETLTVYRCPDEHVTTTAVIDDGKLPATIGCRHDPVGTCRHQARQETPDAYDATRLPPPMWEWHKPTADQLAKFRRAGGPLWQHTNGGGLILRRRRAAP